MLEKLATKDRSKEQTGNSLVPRLWLFQKCFVFVGGSAADVADSCQFADVQLAVLVGGIVPQKGGGDVLFAHLRPPDLLPLCFRICHP